MLQKESKIRILENFYGLDYVFFGKPVSKMTSCCEALIEEYITVKGALMSLMVEMYKLVDHKPEAITEKINAKDLRKTSLENAKIARENAQRLVHSEKGRADIKAELSQVISEDSDINIEEEVKERIRQKAFSLAIDNLLVARTFGESESVEKMNEWEGQIVEDAYKTLRNNLVESALFILEAYDISK